MKVKPQLYNTLLTLLTTTDKVKTRAMPKRVRTPNCTHVDMDRIYGQHQQCFVCGREPSIGFLYECRQDCSASTRSFQELCLQGEGGHVSCSKSPLRTELEAAGLSESVIQSAEQGHYTSAQLKVLKAQKLDLRQTIEDSIQGTQINDVVARLAALSSPSSTNDGTASSKSKDTVTAPALQGSESLVDASQSSPCNFRACHTCRPYYRDRVFISFEAVASAEFAPISKDEAQYLPTKSANTIRYLKGAQPSPPDQTYQDDTPRTLQTSATFTCTSTPNTASTTSDSSELTFKTTQTDVDELRALRRPRRRFYNIGHKSSDEIAREISRIPSLLSRQGLKTAMQAVFRNTNRDSSSEGSIITLPVARTGTVRDDPATEPVGEFDIGALRRVRRQKEKADLRRGTFVHGFDSLGGMSAGRKHGDVLSSHEERSPSRSSESEFSVYSCISDASEMEGEGEDGGVALVDEERGARGMERCKVDEVDAGMNGLADSKASVCVQTTAFEMEDEDDGDEDEGDVGVQGIMAQV
jgi:hypothetical protein